MRTSLKARDSINFKSPRRKIRGKARLTKRKDSRCKTAAKRLNEPWNIPGDSYPSMESFLNTMVKCGHITGFQAKQIRRATHT